MIRLIVLFMCGVFTLPALADYQMRMFLPDFPPYTTMEDGKPAGIGIEAVTPILDAMGVQYTIKVGSNHGRALNALKAGDSDAFFMASQNAERDKVAVFSEPVMVNRWVWVTLASATTDPLSDGFKSTGKTASLLNTNTLKWLEKNQYRVVSRNSDVDGLLKFLDAGRADAIFLAEKTYTDTVTDSSKYLTHVQVEKPFGIYVSKKWLESNSGFMTELNARITQYRAKQ